MSSSIYSGPVFLYLFDFFFFFFFGGGGGEGSFIRLPHYIRALISRTTHMSTFCRLLAQFASMGLRTSRSGTMPRALAVKGAAHLGDQMNPKIGVIYPILL